MLYEEQEQEIFVNWLESKHLKFSAIPNSTFTKSWSQKAKNKRVGLRKGLPDLLILVRKEQSAYDRTLMLFVEMKRLKGAGATPEQKEWIEVLNKHDGIQAKVCRGAEQAKEFIKRFII